MALFVSLLTLIFSFLGAILCAVLAGMMVAVARLPAWHSFVISLISPGVLLTILRTSKADMSDRQMAVLTLLCLGCFWLTYVVAWGLRLYEQKGQANSAVAAARRGSAGSAAGAAGERAGASAAPGPGSPPAFSAAAGGALTLEALQGQWRCGLGANGSTRQKLMKIERERLELICNDEAGAVSFATQAQIRLSLAEPLPVLVLGPNGGEADSLISI